MRRRWFRYGKPWGLLAKANPKATTASVIFHALLWATVGPILYAVAMYFRQTSTDHWAAKLAICALLFALVGGLMEWQIDDSDE